MKVYSYTEPREAILDYPNCFLEQDGGWHGVKLAEGQKHGKGVILRLEGVSDRDQAARLLDCETCG